MWNDESRETKPEYEIHEVEQKYMNQICDIHARCWKKNFKWIIEQAYLDKFGKDPEKRRNFIHGNNPSEYSMFVYDKWWKVLWFIDWWIWEKDWFDFEIHGFYVDPDNQRQWVWRKLWEHLIESKNFKDKNSFYLRTLKDNIAWWNFYKKMWWKIVDEIKRKFGEKEYDLVCYARKK